MCACVLGLFVTGWPPFVCYVITSLRCVRSLWNARLQLECSDRVRRAFVHNWIFLTQIVFDMIVVCLWYTYISGLLLFVMVCRCQGIGHKVSGGFKSTQPSYNGAFEWCSKVAGTSPTSNLLRCDVISEANGSRRNARSPGSTSLSWSRACWGSPR